MTDRPGSRFRVHGRARFVVTDRTGVRRTPSSPSTGDDRATRIGASVDPFGRLDLATHVGDDEAVVLANRAAVLGAVRLTPGALAVMDQVHGASVVVTSRRAAEQVPTADALVTTEDGLALAVLVADCVPVVLADDEAGVVAVAHAGRRGVQSGVVPATVAAMVAAGAEPSRVAAVVGPAICPLCYEVPADMCDEVSAVVPEARALSRTGTPALHLRRAVAAQLAASGVGGIDAVGGCTAEDPSLYSFRRDGRTGRFAMLAWLGDEAPA